MSHPSGSASGSAQRLNTGIPRPLRGGRVVNEIADPLAVSKLLYNCADLHGDIAHGNQSIRAYIITIMGLCLYVAGAEGKLTKQKLAMMQRIFVGEDIEEVWRDVCQEEMENDPVFLEEYLETAESIMRMKWLRFTQLGLPYKAEDEHLAQLVSIVCQTVIAADNNVEEQEFERLSSVSNRLREYALALELERFG